jgi:hypothetical protein
MAKELGEFQEAYEDYNQSTRLWDKTLYDLSTAMKRAFVN